MDLADELRQALQILTSNLGILQSEAIGKGLDPLDYRDIAVPSLEASHRALKRIEAIASKLENADPTDKIECWIVWKKAPDVAQGGRPYLMSVDLTEDQAHRHKRAILDEARLKGETAHVVIEQSWVNHLYGESMTVNFDANRALLQEFRRQGKGG